MLKPIRKRVTKKNNLFSFKISFNSNLAKINSFFWLSRYNGGDSVKKYITCAKNILT